MSAGKEFDVVVYGANGYTGKLVSAYLYHNRTLKWAMSGRSLSKLKSTLEEIQMNGKIQDIPLLIATPEEPKSLSELAERSKVIINCAGPFSVAGEVVVHACVEGKCHYVDITGEPNFYLAMLEKYHEKAKKNGVCIIHGCGLDSIPWDLGVLHAIRGSTQRAYPKISSVVAYAKINLIPSVGTIVSALRVFSKLDLHLIKESVDSWFGHPKESGNQSKSIVKQTLSLLPRVPVLPHYSKELRQWVVPVMGTLDGFIVRRSARLLRKGDPSAPVGYHFGQYFAMGNFLNLIVVIALAFMFGPLLIIVSRLPVIRDFLVKNLRKHLNDGPTAAQRKKCSLEIVFIAKDSDGLQVGKSKVRCPSDPGYESTAKWVAETALLLAEADKVEGGVLTTASASPLGFKLIHRLSSANLSFEHC